MRLAIFPKYAARNSVPVLSALTQGFRHHGVTIEQESLDSDAVIIWSQLWAGRMRPNREVYEKYQDRGKPIWIIDAGCIQRERTWRISTDQCKLIAGSGHDAARREQLGLVIDPWRQQRGSDIVIALQRTDSNQWRDMPDINTWLKCIIHDIRQHTDRPIRIRSHPRNRIIYPAETMELPRPIPGTYDDYDFLESLDRAWCVVNWNSSPGVVAALRGVPVFVGESSLAAPVATWDFSRIEDPEMPDRVQWANDLAWTEWTVAEIEQGIPQRYLLDRLHNQ
jgi:hypothetical protein